MEEREFWCRAFLAYIAKIHLVAKGVQTELDAEVCAIFADGALAEYCDRFPKE